MNGLSQNEFYDSSSRSPPKPRSHQPQQTQTLHRQTSRPFDPYAQDNMYNNEDISSRYDRSRYHDRMGSTMQQNYGVYDMAGMPQAWNSTGFAQNNHLAALGATTRTKPSGRGRSGLPSMWVDQPPPMHTQSQFGNFPASALGFPPMGADQMNGDADDDLIPTAIVIKNIPFAVKKEQLVQVMTDMNLPLPYAFNYHFDNGVFRGLAFANFTTPDETAAVIQGMNHLDLHGRKLRVEYKKMLPQAERDRIEREKRERRGQLEEQHRPLPSTLHNQPSLSSLGSHLHGASPSPITGPGDAGMDMNDPVTLNYYSKLILFQGDPGQGDVLAFPSDIPSSHRTVIHGLAHKLGLHHESHGVGDERRVHVYRSGANGMSPPNSAQPYALDPNRRLNRSATTDFTNVRQQQEQSFYGANGPATQSSGFLGFASDGTQGGLSASAANLRPAKSFADLRYNTPSPAPSTNSFPANLTTNVSRFQEYAPGSPSSQRSNITPTTAGMPGGPDSLISGMNTMSLERGFAPPSGSPNRLRGMVSWDRDNRDGQHSAGPGPIGGHRAYSGNHDEPGRNRSAASMRQQRGGVGERGSGYPRGRTNGHQPRGSDEMSSPSGVEIVVE